MMTRPTEPTEPPPSVEFTVTIIVPATDWSNALKAINKAVQRIRTTINDPVVPYISEWHDRYNTLRQLLDDDPDTPLHTAAARLFTNPSTIVDFCQDLIKIVPPLKEIVIVDRPKPHEHDTATIHFIRNPTADKIDRIMKSHNFWHRPRPVTTPAIELASSSEEEQQQSTSTDNSIHRIAPDLKQQVDAMDKHINDLEKDMTVQIQDAVDRSISTVADTINTKIESAVKKAIEKSFDTKIEETIAKTAEKACTTAQSSLLQNNKDLQESILVGTRTAERLTGDIRRATDTIEQFKRQTHQITQNAIDVEKRTTTHYLDAKLSMEETRDTVIQQIEDATKKAQAIPDPVTSTQSAPSATHHHTPYRQKYADEYMIKGQLVQVRNKKFQEDNTPIKCDGVDELLGMYTLLAQVSHQYGIHLSPITSLDIWKTPGTTKPPTFPYDPSDFDTPQAFTAAYTSMSLALATKLKTSVTFAPTFTAVQLSIDEYAHDGYVNLYHLISMSHHKLQRKKFVRHTKPNFEGNMFQFIAKYKNYILYNQTRQVAHIYDDDEIAEDVIEAIRTS